MTVHTAPSKQSPAVHVHASNVWLCLFTAVHLLLHLMGRHQAAGDRPDYLVQYTYNIQAFTVSNTAFPVFHIDLVFHERFSRVARVEQTHISIIAHIGSLLSLLDRRTSCIHDHSSVLMVVLVPVGHVQTHSCLISTVQRWPSNPTVRVEFPFSRALSN